MSNATNGFFDSQNNDRVYDAGDFRQLIKLLVTNGIDYGTDGSGFEVAAQTPNSMNVDVNVGGAIINGGWIQTTSSTELSISSASTTYGRYDAVVCEFNSSDATRAIQLKVVQGTASGSPEYPTLTQTETIYQLPLAYVFVGANVSSIGDTDITDARTDWLTTNDINHIKQSWIATASALGAIKVGETLNIDSNGVLNANLSTAEQAGIVKAGDMMTIDGNGVMNLKPATRNTLGAVQVGDTMSVDNNGLVDVKPATRNSLGGVSAGVGISITPEGKISVSGGGGGGTYDYEALDNKPSINNVELIGNVTSEELDLGDHLIKVSAPRKAGKTVTLTRGEDTETAVLDENGYAEFRVALAGVYVATVDDVEIGRVSIEVYDIHNAGYTMYGFHLDMTDSNPATMISYDVQYDGVDVDNKDYTPVQMNLTTGVIDSGSWNLDDDFFIPRSCMLKYNGKVDYYLDENDETKKADGTASDVANTSYSGNAMMEWGRDGKKIYLKIVPDATPTNGATFYISDTQVDEDFHAWSFYDCDGNEIDHFYTPKYCGSNISSKLRSISGQVPLNNDSGANEATYANANNVNNKVEWDTETWGDRTLINILLLMIGKSCDTQAVFGEGYSTGGASASSLANSGTLNGKGQWCGFSTNNDKTKGVKVFGMEHWWGNIFRRIRGLLNVSGTIKYKLTYSKVDGTGQIGYDATGEYYKSVTNGTPAGTNGGYISSAVFNEDGIFAKTASGSASTYFCDGLWFNNSQSNYAVVGGGCSSGSLGGALCLRLNGAFSDASWSRGAALSCKPLA